MSQSLSNILIHLVFSTKNRIPMIDSSISGQLYAFLVSLSSELGNYVHKIGGIEDHIHMLISLNRTQPISVLIENLKKNSSRWIKTKGPNYSTFSWQKGYGAFSACSTHSEALINYIATQDEHHKKISFQDEFRHLLKKNNIPFDERYVWD